MIIMGQWTRVENNNEVFLRVTNHTGQAEKNLLGQVSFDDQLPTWPVAQLLEQQTSKPKVAGSNPSRAKYNFFLLVRYGLWLREHLTIIHPEVDVYITDLKHDQVGFLFRCLSDE